MGKIKKSILFCVYFVLVCSLIGCQTKNKIRDERIRGLVFTGPGNGPYKDDVISSISHINGNYVALVPEASVYRQNLKVVYDFNGQWYGETKTALYDGIIQARNNGLKIMIKPHLTVQWDMTGWDRPALNMDDSSSRVSYMQGARKYLATQKSKIDGESSWRGDFMTKTNEDWNVFQKEYTTFILDYAQIADSLKVEMFCVSTELKRIALEKPDYFRRLIRDVKEIYSGHLTYAANWDSFNDIEFWDELDFIGIDAYFPLSELKEPSLDEMKRSWIMISKDLSKVSYRFKKPIIFTEWGAEDEYYVGKEPWIMTKEVKQKNESLQAKAYESMFTTIWNKSWMKGVFVWRWDHYTTPPEYPTYSPSAKEAEKVLKEWFSD